MELLSGLAEIIQDADLECVLNKEDFNGQIRKLDYVIFFHYDITNESTTSYDDNVIFGLYMDSGVGGSALGPDGIL